MNDVQKQRLLMKNREGRTKIVRRGVRTRLEKLEATFVGFLMEIKGALAYVKEKLEEHDEVQGILAKAFTQGNLTDEEQEILREVAASVQQPKVEEAPVAGPGTEADQGE